MLPHKIFSSLFFTAYIGVVYLPQGSSSILVEEMTVAPNNYLALRNMKGHYYLNGGWRLDSEGVYPIAGTKFIYRRPYNRAEMISAEGPLLEDLVLEVSQNNLIFCSRGGAGVGWVSVSGLQLPRNRMFYQFEVQLF